MSGTLIAVCAVGRIHDDVRRNGSTGIDKRPVDGPVGIEPLGVAGDKQYDRNHGGPTRPSTPTTGPRRCAGPPNSAATSRPGRSARTSPSAACPSPTP